MPISDDFLHETARLLTSDRDREFLLRVYQTPEDTYINRLLNMDFVGKSYVLDAGCGFGQWSMALSRLNKWVYSTELDTKRLELAKTVANEIGLKNIKLIQGDLENIPIVDGTFDAIFCYSVIYYTNYEKTLKEFYRILKPNGRLYFCTNGLGWYLYNIIDRPYPSIDFDPRKEAIDAIKNTLEFFKNEQTCPGQSFVMPRNIVIRLLSLIGFSEIIIDGEGKIIVIPKGNPPVSFFKESYYGEEGVYEILCKKLT